MNETYHFFLASALDNATLSQLDLASILDSSHIRGDLLLTPGPIPPKMLPLTNNP
jgi:hypothetical protein